MLVTGATSGIGLHTAMGLAGRGMRVIVHGRTIASARRATAAIVGAVPGARLLSVAADFGSLAAVASLASQVRAVSGGSLHVLVNNAGLASGSARRSSDGFELTMAVNHLAPFLLTAALLPTLQANAPARVVTVASVAHAWARPRRGRIPLTDGPGGLRSYAHSKLANVLFTYALARRLQGSTTSATCLHPGAVRTRLGRRGSGGMGMGLLLLWPLALWPQTAARTSILLASDPTVEGISGAYYASGRAVRSSAASHDRQLQEWLWHASEQVTLPFLGAASDVG